MLTLSAGIHRSFGHAKGSKPKPAADPTVGPPNKGATSSRNQRSG